MSTPPSFRTVPCLKPNLRVVALQASLLLAMKVRAARPQDIDDIAMLAEYSGLADEGEIMRLANDAYGPQEPLPVRSRAAVREALDRLRTRGGHIESDGSA